MGLSYRDYSPSEDVMQKLDLSRRRAAEVQTRDVRCPYCHRLIAIIPVDQTDLIFPKCQKCKFDGPLDPRYFRRMKAYRDYLGSRHWKKPVR